MSLYPEFELPDPFPSSAPPNDPIIPVDEEDVEEPNTGMIRKIAETDSAHAEHLARQKLRATSQKIRKVERELTPSEVPRVPDSKKPG